MNKYHNLLLYMGFAHHGERYNYTVYIKIFEYGNGYMIDVYPNYDAVLLYRVHHKEGVRTTIMKDLANERNIHTDYDLYKLLMKHNIKRR